MLLPENIHPENTLMFNGALVIRAMRELGEAELFELYAEAKGKTGLTMALFVLTLDWLFLANVVDFNDQGKVVLCS